MAMQRVALVHCLLQVKPAVNNGREGFIISNSKKSPHRKREALSVLSLWEILAQKGRSYVRIAL
jgi:hypothetical protein